MIEQSEICKARSLFISRGILNENVINKPIMHSWVRSKLHHISVEFLDDDCEVSKINLAKLSLIGKELIKGIRNIAASHSVIYLLNDRGDVLYKNNHLNLKTPKLWSFSEEVIGTSAGGISVNSFKNSKVCGCEHYNQELIHFISETLVIAEDWGLKNNIVLVLTPLRYASHHDHLFKNLKEHYEKKPEEIIVVKEINEEIKEDPVIKHTVQSVNKSTDDNKDESSCCTNCNDCKVFTLSLVEKNTISRALSFYDWNLKKTAEALGIGRSTLYRKVKEYQINKL